MTIIPSFKFAIADVLVSISDLLDAISNSISVILDELLAIFPYSDLCRLGGLVIGADFGSRES